VSGDIVVNGTTYRQYDGEWFEVESEYRRRFLTPQEHAALVEIERLQAVLSAIDAEHCSTEEVEGFSGTFCAACDDWWPCATHRLLHPEEARRER
jgi:hypothetical protein